MNEEDKTIQAEWNGDSYSFKEFYPTDKETPATINPILNKDQIEVVELELGSFCNLSCPLCQRSWSDAQHLIDKKKQRPVEEIIAQLEEFPSLRIITIAGIISEPTLHPGLFKLMEYIVSRNVVFYLYTNGSTYNDPEYWKTMGALCNEKTLVYWTICGTTQELHEKYRVGSDLQQLLKNHEAFKSGMRYKNDVLQYIRFEYNYKDYEDNIDTIRAKFSRESSIETTAFKERFNLVNPVPEDMTLRTPLKKKYNTIVKFGKKRFQEKHKCKMDCPSLKTKFVAIDQNGKMFPCYLHRVYNPNLDWNFDYTSILNAEHDFCFECEKFTSDMINNTDGLIRIVEC
jgi:MoaA/NifB/PqqE/SkfB family radical SAM enzyme